MVGGTAAIGLRVAAATAAAVALALPAAATAGAPDVRAQAAVPASLLEAAQANPDRTFDVIVQGSVPSARLGADVRAENGRAKREFASIAGVAASLSGKQLLKLARHPHVTAITPDVELRTTAYEDGSMWRWSINLPSQTPSQKAPAIAIVDSGVQQGRKDFDHQVVASVNLSSLAPSATGDDQGHGTMVAGLAAAKAASYEGAAPGVPLVDVRTADAQGKSLTSDVIAACDWILAHKAQYNIRVANFSMNGGVESSFTSDPLDKAVERLWFNGIVVVTAAGNAGNGSGPVPIGAPANDPFVITVGALDQHKTFTTPDDTVPWWSSYGHTIDGFAKPELSAPGRYLIGPVPLLSSMRNTFSDRIVAGTGGYMWMSGTSFAAPLVAGAAVHLLDRHPSWTPGQVKGALMLTARALPLAGLAGGVGEPNVVAAHDLVSPPNANENLDAFVVFDPVTCGVVFDTANWVSAVGSNANWTSANWSGANWSGANWSTANWATANWTSANWSTANWASANWSGTAWAEAGGAE